MAFNCVIILRPFCEPGDGPLFILHKFMLKLASVVHLYSATVPVFAYTLDLETPIYILYLLLCLSSQFKM